MSSAVPLLPLADLPEGRGRRVCAAGHDLALFRFGDTVYAIDDGCPHAGASLSSGRIEGRRVICRAHGLKFSLEPSPPGAPPMLEPKRHCVRTVARIVTRFPDG